jgi:hypothetical protein
VYIDFLAVDVVELEYADVALAAVGTRVRLEVGQEVPPQDGAARILRPLDLVQVQCAASAEVLAEAFTAPVLTPLTCAVEGGFR